MKPLIGDTVVAEQVATADSPDTFVQAVDRVLRRFLSGRCLADSQTLAQVKAILYSLIRASERDGKLALCVHCNNERFHRVYFDGPALTLDPCHKCTGFRETLQGVHGPVEYLTPAHLRAEIKAAYDSGQIMFDRCGFMGNDQAAREFATHLEELREAMMTWRDRIPSSEGAAWGTSEESE